MLRLRRILFASAVAPLALVAPLFAYAFLLWSTSDLVNRPGSSLSAIGSLAFAGGIAFNVFLVLFVFFAGGALILRALRVLTRRALLVLSASVSVALGASMACDWGNLCEPRYALPQFALQASICCILLSLLSLCWWRLATRGAQNVQVGTNEA